MLYVVCALAFIILFLALVANSSEDNIIIFNILIALMSGASIILLSINFSKPTALDVYQHKTELRITYEDKIPVDTTVIYKKGY